MITWLAEYTCFQNFKQYLDSEHSSNTMIGKTKLKRAHIETRLIQQCTWVQGNIYSRAFTVDLQDWFETNITCINTHALSWLANRSTVNIFMYSWMLLVEDINEHYYVILADRTPNVCFVQLRNTLNRHSDTCNTWKSYFPGITRF